MPKPLDKGQGSGMHTHMSLFEGDVNAFHDSGDPMGLSDTIVNSWLGCFTMLQSLRRLPTNLLIVTNE